MEWKNWLLAFTVFVSPLAFADDDDDEREALRRSVERGEVVPLMTLITRIQNEYRGEIIEVELEYDDGRLEYEIDLLTPDGHKIEFEFDARTGEQLEVKGRGLRDARR
ncbi:PepSY domain-containing protein [Polycyclovorans algicola]|uniref:PepSY domain-containing protein n=1 Tax=Polycyclovorans algicola TaxID=616992 RepID=UPI0004A73D63|nr:PepSY domain-containing protein [Polycyclovorans algicola]